MEIKKLIIRNDRLPSPFLLGWGNGYIGVPSGHPWHGKDYDDLDVDVHGGLTYDDDHPPGHLSAETCEEGYWWFGFDSRHHGDNIFSCSRWYVEAQTDRLYQQACAVYDPPTIREESDYRQLDPYL